MARSVTSGTGDSKPRHSLKKMPLTKAGRSPVVDTTGGNESETWMPFDAGLVRLVTEAKNAELYTKFVVAADPDYPSRIGYDAEFYLTGDHPPEKIGHMHGYRVLKKSNTLPLTDNQPWIKDWLRLAPDSYDDSNREMVYSMRALYKRTGAPRLAGDEGLDHNDDLVFIQSVHIVHKYSGKGLLKHAFPMYYRAFTSAELKEEYRVHGKMTFVLEPGYPNDRSQTQKWDQTRGRTETDDDFNERVAGQLEVIYQKPSIGYEVLAKNFVLQGCLHTILGCRVQTLRAGPGEAFGTFERIPRAEPAPPPPPPPTTKPLVILGEPILEVFLGETDPQVEEEEDEEDDDEEEEDSDEVMEDVEDDEDEDYEYEEEQDDDGSDEEY